MNRFSIQRVFICGCILSLVSALVSERSASAHSDIFLADVGGRVAVGGANELGTVDEYFDLTTQVFEGVMISNFPPFNEADYGRDEPGFRALASGAPGMPAGASALPGSADVTINFPAFTVGSGTDVLFYWDGSGAVDFQPVTQPNVSLVMDSAPIDTTGVAGDLHIHSAFKLGDDMLGVDVPADGVYLASPTASVEGLTDSKPYFTVFLVDQLLFDEEAAEEVEEGPEAGMTVHFGKDFAFFEEAVEYVQHNLVVPEPGSGLLGVLALAGMGAMTTRRRGAEGELE